MTLASTPAYNPDRVSDRGSHAIVIGGSMAGLMTARVLTDAFKTVTIIEKDPLPDAPTVRDGTPQAAHGHAMQEAGRATLEALFPGYSDDLTAAGGLEIDLANDFNHHDLGGYLADGDDRLPWLTASRKLFEHVTRQRVVELDEITIRDNCQVSSFLSTGDDSAIEGVSIRTETNGKAYLDADLVVDATGRTSRTPDWLDTHGYAAPPVDEVEIDLAYSSVELARPSGDHRGYIVMLAPPRKRGLGLFPIEDDRWLLTLAGVHGDHPPTNPADFPEFLDEFPSPVFQHLCQDQEFLTEVNHYPFPASRRHRYWECDRFPDGLVVIGDAIASFNPVYGQGMSVAALEALHLHHELATESDHPLPLRFFASIETVVDDAWGLAVGSDFRFAETSGPKPPGTDLMNRYFARLIRKAHTDHQLATALNRVTLMQDRPTTLLRPRVAWRVLKPSPTFFNNWL